MYKLFFRPLVFLLSAETAHHFTFGLLKFISKSNVGLSILKLIYGDVNREKPTELFGLQFPNRVGLAAGLDKNAEAIDAFAAMGFGFVEVGTVTPKAQPGNPLPRLFRLKKDKAIINRMGFNNEGVEAVKSRLEKRKSDILVGGNIGKNKVTPNEEAVNDYLICFKSLFDVVDYFVVNVSSPNTPGLRELQEKKPLSHILNSLMEENIKNASPKPILLKIAPDLSEEQLIDIIDIVKTTGIAGVIANNTTIDRSNLKASNHQIESIGNGGLSGKPVLQRSNEVLQFLSQKSNNAFPIVGVGGIQSAEDAISKLSAGASLLQVYTGFIYEGPDLIKRINKKISHSTS